MDISIALGVGQESPRRDAVWAIHGGSIHFLTWHWKAVPAGPEMVA